MDDVDLAYVALRNRQVHDLWHVVFGCPTTVAGELGLKALEFVQVRDGSRDSMGGRRLHPMPFRWVAGVRPSEQCCSRLAPCMQRRC